MKSAAIAAVAGLVIYLVSPRLFFLLLQIGGLAMMALSAAVMVMTFRKAKTVSPRALLLSMGISLLTATIVAGLSKAHSSTAGLLGTLGLLFGLLIGSGWAMTTHVVAEDGQVRSRGSGWYLAVWVMTLMLTQTIPMLTGRTPAASLVLLFLGTGIVLGNSSVMIARWWLLRPPSLAPLP